MQLSDPLEDHFRLVATQKKALEKLGLQTIQDLLFHYPARYESNASSFPINELKKGDDAIIYGTISKLKTRKAWKSKVPISEAFIENGSGKIKAMWFHQPYIAKMIPENAQIKAIGKVAGTDAKPYLANPEISTLDTLPEESASLLDSGNKERVFIPVYPESKGITSRWMHHALQKIFAEKLIDELIDPIPEKILKQYSLPSLRSALIWIHTPQKESDAVASRKRFAFEEVFFIQLSKQQDRYKTEHSNALQVSVDKTNMQAFIDRFPFEPTKAQTRVINTILDDLAKSHPMSRLLEGDVGSGKTAVAAATIHSVTTTRPAGQNFGALQTAYMVPTEILAKQHFESFIHFFDHLGISIGLITSSGCKKYPSKVDPTQSTTISRTQLLKWIANGEIPILIGTHSLIQKTVQFKNLAYVIIDEQHRFGTLQRQKLVRKDDITPHLLSMTATPIPRTLALTMYGDLDLSLIDEMPKGRKPIITEIVTPAKRNETYGKVRIELQKGRQVYVICPRINEPDPNKELALQAKSVKEEAKRLACDVFPEFRVDIMHSKMKPKEKDEAMQKFERHETDILVSTSVVEVGVNVPNATTIVIEGAERFGLAQLHQLRGRVLRSTHQAYCYAFTESKSKTATDRLKALKAAKNGFELAEYDLQQRGSGELYGKRQWGISDMGMEAIQNIKMVEAARNEAQKLVADDPTFSKSPILKEKLSARQTLHFE